MNRYVFLLLLALYSIACGKDWVTKEETQKLKGRWNLASIKAIDKDTSKDTTWNVEGGFIEFVYTKKPGAAPFSYALTADDPVTARYSVQEGGSILVMPDQEVKASLGKKVAFPVNERNSFELIGEKQLLIRGTVVIRDNAYETTSGKMMQVEASFFR